VTGLSATNAIGVAAAAPVHDPIGAVAGTGQSTAASASGLGATIISAPSEPSSVASASLGAVHLSSGAVADVGRLAPVAGSRPSGLLADVTADRDRTAAESAQPSVGRLAGAASVAAGSPLGDVGTLVLVDVVPELLAAAEESAAVAGDGAVGVRAVRADLADPASFAGLPLADLVWASNVVHHVPDQRAAVTLLAGLLAPGGCLALAEGGLSMRCLPWDLGVGEPGLQDRLIAAHGTWFRRMRAGMPDAVRLPVGWNLVLSEAGLRGVTAFSYLVDVPAPLSADGRGAVVSWLAWMSHGAADLLDPADVATLDRLLDPDDPAYVARRDDIFMLKASTVYLGWR
jgi:SAM-dependent methyltransferase